MSKINKTYECYRCKKDVVGIENVAGWDEIRVFKECEFLYYEVPICGDCSYKGAVDKINELYTGDDEINFWRHEAMGC